MKTAIVITTYNRPVYLKQCLDSISNTYLPPDTLIYITDDGSHDRETLRLIKNFTHGCEVLKKYNKKNSGILHTLLDAYDYCFGRGFDYVIIINDDAVVNNYFYETMTYYKHVFPNYVISGFNTLTHSELQKPRHPIIRDEWFYCMKNTSGGLCYGIDKKIYNKYFKHVISRKIGMNNKHAYDTESTAKASSEGCFVICPKPSIAEHVGIDNSTMNHTYNPDVSLDFSRVVQQLDRKQITINMATFPAREKAFEQVIENLLTIKAIDKIRVYLNKYYNAPSFLNDSRIEYVLGGPDIMDTGKFYWAGTYKNEYYFTLDDDFIIDEQYIRQHLLLLNKYDNKVFVSLHGKVLVEKPENFRDLSAHYDFSADVQYDSFSNFLGTGVMVFDNAKYRLVRDMFVHHGMTDLYIAKYCQENNIPCIVRKHGKSDVQLIYRGPDELWNRRDEFAVKHREILQSVQKWKLIKP